MIGKIEEALFAAEQGLAYNLLIQYEVDRSEALISCNI